VDNLVPYYDPAQKRSNLDELAGLEGFESVVADLRTADLQPLLSGVDVVFHQAGQPGVRASWDEFPSYVEHNINITQRLLEASRSSTLKRFVYASSSSVYGEADEYPTRETALPRPKSPYGVTKLAGEHLCGVYARNWEVPTVSLRYFTVYGPRQRPDMAFHKLVEASFDRGVFPLFGDGGQVRDFTFVDDVVNANLLAAEADLEPGFVANIAGGTSVDLATVIQVVEELTGKPVPLANGPEQAGDVRRTGGSTDRAHRRLGWEPQVDLREGLARQIEWHRSRDRISSRSSRETTD
jgi:UDP-glucuronate 4-epimerase